MACDFTSDFHAHLALDRREERTNAEAAPVPLWFKRS